MVALNGKKQDSGTAVKRVSCHDQIKKEFEESMKGGWGMVKNNIRYEQRCFFGIHYQKKIVTTTHWLAFNWETLWQGMKAGYGLTNDEGAIAFEILWKIGVPDLTKLKTEPIE